MTEQEGDRLLSQVLGPDLMGATLRLAIIGLVISAIAATVLAIIT
jgi:hypothetical protein